MYQRALVKKIKPYLKHKNAIVITGARQVGKTSLLRLIFEKLPLNQRKWFDFENPLHYKIFEDIDYDDIYKKFEQEGLAENKRKYIFIDEIQNYPEITKIVKYLIDHYNVKFFLTGSSSFYMKNLFPESLSGRKFVFNLFPLNFREFLYFKGMVKNLKAKDKFYFKKATLSDYEKYDLAFQEYKEWGGFPEVALTKNKSTKKLVLENIFKSFIEQDILRLSDYKNVREIRDLLLLLARRVGSRLDISRLSQELGVERYKIYSYLEFLEATFVIHLMPIFSRSIDRQVAAGKKVYFNDSGLVNQITKLGEGQLLENTVFNMLKEYGKLSYYQTKSKQEVDFILNNEMAFEVKKTGTEYDRRRLEKLADKIAIPKRYLISESYVEGVEGVVYPQGL